MPGFIGGRRFVLQIEPPIGVTPRGRILCVQSLSEEANLGRRVLVAMAAEMALQGWIVSIPDLFGTGDSDGESEEITLATWRSDLTRLALRDPAAGNAGAPDAVPAGGMPAGRLVLWGVRTGCALAVDLLARNGLANDALLLWQPVVAGPGSPLRLRTATAPVPHPDTGSDAGKDAVGENELAIVHGYRYRQSLLDELAALQCDPPQGQDHADRPVAILHMGRRLASASPGAAGPTQPGNGEEAAPARLPPAVTRLADQWQASGSRMELHPARAEPFWGSIEPVMPREAFAASLAFLAGL